MDRPNRLRLALVGFLTLGVMVGVVAAAWHAKQNQASDEGGPLPPLSGAGMRAGDGRKAAELPPECRPDKSNPGKLRFDLPSDVLDLGSVKQGAILERDVVVRNTGSGTLCVPEKPRTGCGCVQAEWVGPMRLRPTETGLVRLRIDTKGKEGHVDKDVTIVSNDPDRPESVFHVKCEVKLGVLVARTANVTAGSVVYFGRHAPGKPATAVVRLKTPREDPEWKVTGVESAKTGDVKTRFTWSVAPAEPNDPVFRQFDVTIVHPGSEQLDLNDEPLKIVTTHPDRPEILLHSQLLVAKRYYTSPPTVRFGFVGGANSTVASPRTLTVFPGEEGTKFRVTKAEVDGRGFTTGEPVDHGNDGWQVEVRYDGQSRGRGPVDAKLILHVEGAEAPPADASSKGPEIVEVPLHAEVRD